MPTATAASRVMLDLNSGCYLKATTQFELNRCAAEHVVLAKAKLMDVQGKIDLPPADKASLNQFLAEWQTLAERTCMFLFGQQILSGGALVYEKGSMAPLLIGRCIAADLEQLIQDLVMAFPAAGR